MKQLSHVAFVHNVGIQRAISVANIFSFCGASPVGTNDVEKTVLCSQHLSRIGYLEYDIGANNRTVTKKLLFIT